MAYQTGTASDELDLLDKLNLFLTSHPELEASGQTWEAIHEINTPATDNMKALRHFAWRSTSTGTEAEIYFTARTENNISDDIYNLLFTGGTYFNQSFITGNIGSGLVNFSPSVRLCVSNRSFTYHFVANGRCVKIATIVDSVCSTAYIGFILPITPPAEYPYPMCVAGSAPVLDFNNSRVEVRYSNTTYHSSIVDATYGNVWLFTPDQTWRDFSSTNYRNYTNDSQYQCIYPNAMWREGVFFEEILLGIAGEKFLLPVELVSTRRSTQGVNRWGCYDGIYWMHGRESVLGDTVTLPDGREGIVLRKGSSTHVMNYFVLMKE